MSGNNNPLISIVVPVYGTEAMFGRCIGSLISQTYKNIEIIIVNDGSPGEIRELMKAYSGDSRIKFVDLAVNQGLLRARVAGAKTASGSYIAFVDSDDYVSEDFYRTLIDRALASDSDIVIGKTVWEKDGERYVYNLHESNFHFEVMTNPQIQYTYFGQELQCYSWHTIWNKVYRKSLWDKCSKEFESVERHVVMTEDIFFSSLLFFNAKRIACARSEAYFYCVNETASTNSKGISLERYLKNVDDISYVFNTVLLYLKEQGADPFISDAFLRGMAHYGRMWKSLAENTFDGDDLKCALEKVSVLCDPCCAQKTQHDYFFESIKTPWNGGLEYIKQEIRESTQPYVSFDIFDTLIVRPLYDPADLYTFLDKPFAQLTDNTILFDAIRVEGEALARSYYGRTRGFADITIDEIYAFISEHYGIDHKVTDQIRDLEKDLEYRFCQVRGAGLELFEYAKYIGKHVILISDMYLDRKTIENILEKNHISGYENIYLSCEKRALKWNGELYFEAFHDLGITDRDIIHIGDTWKSDIEGAQTAGIRSIFFPKAREVFENKISGCDTNRCSDIAKQLCDCNNIDYENIKANLGYRCMQAISANYYFDNPYRTFHPASDFNIDPYFVGYCLLGMHMLGLAKHLHTIWKDYKYKGIAFLSRDGHLPLKIFRQYAQCMHEEAKTLYVQASRKAVMPVLIKEKLNFYQLPVEYRAHSPKTLTDVMSFAMKNGQDSIPAWRDILQSNDLIWDKTFENKQSFHRFISLFLKHEYDPCKHRLEQEKVRRYYGQIPDHWIAFDVGYSGRIQSAICAAAGKPVDAAFVHEEYQTSTKLKDICGYRIFSFYNYKPEISGLIREHLLSDVAGSCIGFEELDGKIIPILEPDCHIWPDRFTVMSIHQGASDFAGAFLKFFGGYIDIVDYPEEVISMPFEAFLRYPNPMDMHLFSASYFEDTVFGARQEINIEEFTMQNLRNIGWPEPEKSEPGFVQTPLNDDEKRILEMINGSSQIKRALVWLLLDFSFLIEKIKLNIKRFRKQ